MDKSYRLSFTAAAFRLPESIDLAKRYLRYDNWQDALQDFTAEDAVRNTKRTSQREGREIVLRLRNLSKELLEKLVSSETDEAKVILFYAILKSYPIIRSFCLNVLAEKMMLMDNVLQEYEINRFFREEAERHEVLHQKAESTQKKLRQVMLKILADAGFLKSTKERIIIKPYIDPTIARPIAEDGGESYLRALLMNENEIALTKAGK